MCEDMVLNAVFLGYCEWNRHFGSLLGGQKSGSSWSNGYTIRTWQAGFIIACLGIQNMLGKE